MLSSAVTTLDTSDDEYVTDGYETTPQETKRAASPEFNTEVDEDYVTTAPEAKPIQTPLVTLETAVPTGNEQTLADLPITAAEKKSEAIEPAAVVATMATIGTTTQPENTTGEVSTQTEKTTVEASTQTESQSPASKEDLEQTLDELVMMLEAALTLHHKLTEADPKDLDAALKKKGGHLAQGSFKLVSELTSSLMYLLKELLQPDPQPLSAQEKDEKAYQAVRAKLEKNPALQELLDHIWKRSSFLNIGKNIGPDAKPAANTLQLSAVTINGAWLPTIFGVSLNSFLRSNYERSHDTVNLLQDFIENIAPLDFIFFEEAWKTILCEGETRRFLKAEFEKLGYEAFGDEAASAFSMGSGLLGFSRHHIIDQTFKAFIKRRAGTETIAHKGIEGAKVVIDLKKLYEKIPLSELQKLFPNIPFAEGQDKFLLTVIMTHETSGDGIFNDKNVLGTTSELRGEEQQLMHNLAEEWGAQPVINKDTGQPYPHLGVVFAGDTNKTNNQLYQLLSLCTGNSPYNQRQQGDVKYSGDFNNLKAILTKLRKDCWPFARNAVDIMSQKTERAPGGKPTNEEALAEAKQENLATGSTYSVADLKANKAGKKELTLQDTERRMIDIIAVKPTRQEYLKAFECYFINLINSDKKAISDHLGLLAIWAFALENVTLPTLSDKKSITQFGNSAPVVKLKEAAPVAQQADEEENYLAYNFGS